MTLLNTIYKHKLCEIEERKKYIPVGFLRENIQKISETRSFEKALTTVDGDISIIAEVKKASPSSGVMRENFQPVEIACIYENSGASAISVLTDEKFFQGSLSYLADIKKTVTIPVLRKDFIVDSYQIYEARSAGADAILLIAELLSCDEIQQHINTAEELGLDCLVETHSKDELLKILQTNAKIIGINNRNLETFVTDIETTFRLRDLIPDDKIVVSESGITSREEIKRLLKKGIHAVLIGETLMKSSNVSAKLHELLGN
ncbi:MAG: indole-3-glycerol phosphate synthase TrpC [Candidatus Brocadiaceae bacterium]|nr:indole-3-glycerol phosphate synthase TrpC [Candidatus Brocadiaceae bacterium]